MQTFIPYANFEKCAKVLDRGKHSRLNKQITEAEQIYNCIVKGTGWIHHPIVGMWRGYENALLYYRNVMLKEWYSIGGNYKKGYIYPEGEIQMPWWLGIEEIHRSHRSMLIQKNPKWYKPLFSNTPDDLPYIWWSEKRGFYSSVVVSKKRRHIIYEDMERKYSEIRN